MEKQIMKENVGSFDKANRILMGTLLLVVMLATPDIPTWLLLVPLYPILTAIAAWDPVYALFNVGCMAIEKKLSYKGRRLALG